VTANVRIDLVNAGAHFKDAAVVVDGNIITGRQPLDTPDFLRAIETRLLH
jgi:protease I